MELQAKMIEDLLAKNAQLSSASACQVQDMSPRDTRADKC